MRSIRLFLRSAWVTVISLIGSLLAGLLLGTVLFELLPGSSVEDPSPVHASIAAIPALAGFLAGGWIWGAWFGRLAGAGDPSKTARAGLIGFGPLTLMLAVSLAFLEPVLVRELGARLPVHRLFTLLFVPSAFLIAGATSWSFGRALGGSSLGLPLAWRAGLAAALAFTAANLAMEAGGWVVGAPQAAERATMLVVLFTGNVAAAVAAGGVLGLAVGRRVQAENPAT